MPAGIGFSYLENAILGLLKAEIVRNIHFHIEHSLSDLSAMVQGKPLICGLDFQFHPDTTLLSYW